MTEADAIIAAEIDAELAAERYETAAQDDEHPELLDRRATEAYVAMMRFKEMLLLEASFA